jgi:hypothetical protein
MKPKRARQCIALTAKEFRAVNEVFIMIYQELKINLWLCFFMVLERIKGTSKKKDRQCTTGIGFS